MPFNLLLLLSVGGSSICSLKDAKFISSKQSSNFEVTSESERTYSSIHLNKVGQLQSSNFEVSSESATIQIML